MYRPFPSSPLGLRLAALLLLTSVVTLGACSKKKPRSSPPVKTPEWHGLRIGMAQKKAEQRLKGAGLRVHCAPAQNVTYLDGKALYTLWIKKGQEKRVVRCLVRRKKGAKPGLDGVLESKLYFLDGKLYRLHVKLFTTDLKFDRLLRARYGVFLQAEISRHAYAGKKPSVIRMWTLTQKATRLLWLRSSHHQQLVLFTTSPDHVKALKALSSARKGE